MISRKVVQSFTHREREKKITTIKDAEKIVKKVKQKGEEKVKQKEEEKSNKRKSSRKTNMKY